MRRCAHRERDGGGARERTVERHAGDVPQAAHRWRGSPRWRAGRRSSKSSTGTGRGRRAARRCGAARASADDRVMSLLCVLCVFARSLERQDVQDTACKSLETLAQAFAKRPPRARARWGRATRARVRAAVTFVRAARRWEARTRAPSERGRGVLVLEPSARPIRGRRRRCPSGAPSVDGRKSVDELRPDAPHQLATRPGGALPRCRDAAPPLRRRPRRARRGARGRGTHVGLERLREPVRHRFSKAFGARRRARGGGARDRPRRATRAQRCLPRPRA